MLVMQRYKQLDLAQQRSNPYQQYSALEMGKSSTFPNCSLPISVALTTETICGCLCGNWLISTYTWGSYCVTSVLRSFSVDL